MRLVMCIVLAWLPIVLFSHQAQSATIEAPSGLDGLSNGMVDDVEHQRDRQLFDQVETVGEGLGPIYNAQSCRECHQNPLSGGASQITELRAGHIAADGTFEGASIAIGDGSTIIANRSLVNDRAICPNHDFPDAEIQERVPETETLRTQRLSLNLLGDGYVEAVADQTFLDLAKQQCSSTRGKICGQAIMVPVVENPGITAVGRFGWKDQHASLLSFSAEAYLNEMGVTSTLFPDEVVTTCNIAFEPNNMPELLGEHGVGLDDAGHFARYIRSTMAPARDHARSTSSQALRGSDVFDQIGCSICHVRTLTTAPAGTKVYGGVFTIPPALGDKVFHPFSDFLLHDVGTGDGFVVLADEHFGRRVKEKLKNNLPPKFAASTANKMRTAPLWGVRFRTRLMHDGASYTFSDAISRHGGEASSAARNYMLLPTADRAALLEFLKSL